MSSEITKPSIAIKLKKISLFLSIILALVGFIVLIAWTKDIKILMNFSPQRISMKANSAYCFLLSGIALILFNIEKPGTIAYIVAYTFSLVIIFIASTALVEYCFNISLGIDNFFLKDTISQGKNPGRLPFESSLCFILFGAAFILSGFSKINPLIFQCLCLVAGTIAMMVFLSYLFNIHQLKGIEKTTTMAFYSSFSFIILMLAALFLKPEVGIMKRIINKK